MSCDGGCFTPDGAYDSLWVALPMKESTPSFPSCTKRTLGVSACSMTGTAATTIFAPTTTTIPGLCWWTSVAVRSWRCICSVTRPSRSWCPDVQKTADFSAVAAHVVMGRLFRAVYTGTRPGLTSAIRAGKGWRGRRELAPRCSATRIRCI